MSFGPARARLATRHSISATRATDPPYRGILRPGPRRERPRRPHVVRCEHALPQRSDSKLGASRAARTARGMTRRRAWTARRVSTSAASGDAMSDAVELAGRAAPADANASATAGGLLRYREAARRACGAARPDRGTARTFARRDLTRRVGLPGAHGAGGRRAVREAASSPVFLLCKTHLSCW